MTAAPPATMSNASLVAEVRPALDATSRYPVPAVPIRRLLNVAVPAVAVADRLPVRLALEPGASAMVTSAAAVTRLPYLSVTSTSTAGVMARSAALSDGGTLKARRLGSAGAALAVNTIARPGTLGDAAVSVCAPGSVPSTQPPGDATPAGSVVTRV